MKILKSFLINFWDAISFWMVIGSLWFLFMVFFAIVDADWLVPFNNWLRNYLSLEVQLTAVLILALLWTIGGKTKSFFDK